MKLVFLGTGAGIPSKERNTSAIALVLSKQRNETWLFDCGEGTQHQILKSQIKLSLITKIFITHLHGDHIYGLLGLLSTRSFQGKDIPLVIYGPVGIKEFVTKGLELSHTFLTYTIDFVEFQTEQSTIHIDNFTIDIMLLKHGIDSFGFRITEDDQTGSIDAKKLMADGIMPGPIFQQLKKGEIVSLDDGRVINGTDYLGAMKKGKIVTIFGDTAPSPNEILLAKDADIIVHEATLGHEMMEQANENMHSTTIQVAELAKTAKAKKLIITHISARYTIEENQKLLDECCSVFSDTIIANDFLTFDI